MEKTNQNGVIEEGVKVSFDEKKDSAPDLGFDELFESLGEDKEIKGSKKSYSSVEIKNLIDKVRAGGSINLITRSGGLRQKVGDLLKVEKLKKDLGIKIPESVEGVEKEKTDKIETPKQEANPNPNPNTNTSKELDQEKNKIYDNPLDDPAIKNLDSETERFTLEWAEKMGFSNVSTLRETAKGMARNQALDNFIKFYPEKARAYMDKNEELKERLWGTIAVENLQKKVNAERVKMGMPELDFKINSPETKQEKAVNINNSSVEVDKSSKEKEIQKNDSIVASGNQNGSENEIVASREIEKFYDNPQDDPIIKDVESKTSKLASEMVLRYGPNFSHAEELARSMVLEEFVVLHPKKAVIYAEKYPILIGAMNSFDGGYEGFIERYCRHPVPNMEENSIINETDSFNASETKKTEISDIIKSELTYQDADIPEEKKRKALESYLSKENAKHYAEALSSLAKEISMKEIEGVASGMVKKCNEILNKIEIKPTPYAKSKSWAMWDIGKQFYFLTHQREADSKYKLAHPINSLEKQKEIVDRHVGWETHMAFKKMSQAEKQLFLERFKDVKIREQISVLLSKTLKSDGQLSSLDLARLGDLISQNK